MTLPIEPQIVTDAMLVLVSALTGKQCGDHEAPLDPQMPYTVLHRIDGGGLSGPEYDSPFVDTTYVFQLDAVGEARVQAEALAGRIRTRLLAVTAGVFAWPLVLPGTWHDMDREPDASPAGAERVGTLWQVCDRYRITVTP